MNGINCLSMGKSEEKVKWLVFSLTKKSGGKS